MLKKHIFAYGEAIASYMLWLLHKRGSSRDKAEKHGVFKHKSFCVQEKDGAIFRGSYFPSDGTIVRIEYAGEQLIAANRIIGFAHAVHDA